LLPRSRIALEWQAFWLALGFLTRIPMLVRIDYSQRLMNQSSVYFPLVGLLLGLGYCAAYFLFSLVASPLAAIILVVILHLFITGAFHEDGLADSVDALGGGYTVEKRRDHERQPDRNLWHGGTGDGLAAESGSAG